MQTTTIPRRITPEQARHSNQNKNKEGEGILTKHHHFIFCSQNMCTFRLPFHVKFVEISLFFAKQKHKDMLLHGLVWYREA